MATKKKPEIKKKPETEYVTRGTMLAVAFATLLIGFLGGVVFSVYTSSPVQVSNTSPMPSQPSPQQDVSAEQIAKIPALERETMANPNNLQAWTELGNAYFDTEQYAKAIEAYKKSLALDENNANVWTDLGVMYRRNGQPKEAVAAFDKANQIDPAHEVSLFNKGIVQLYDLKDREGAIKTWEQLVSINPTATAPGRQARENAHRPVGAGGEIGSAGSKRLSIMYWTSQFIEQE